MIAKFCIFFGPSKYIQKFTLMCHFISSDIQRKGCQGKQDRVKSSSRKYLTDGTQNLHEAALVVCLFEGAGCAGTLQRGRSALGPGTVTLGRLSHPGGGLNHSSGWAEDTIIGNSFLALYSMLLDWWYRKHSDSCFLVVFS